MKIGEFSKLSKTTIKTIRYYDKKGLLKPSYIDPVTSYRYYGEEELSVMNQIIMYRKCGFTIDEISRLLHVEKEQKNRLLLDKIEHLKSEIKTIKSNIIELEACALGEQLSKYTAEIKELESYNVFSCHLYIQSPEEITSSVHKMIDKFKMSYPDVTFPQNDYCCIIYPESAYREDDLVIEFNQEIDGIGQGDAIFKFKKLEAATVISVCHRGGYENLRDAYLFAALWAKKHNLTISAQARERYLRGPWSHKNQEDWITEIQLPIIKEDKICI